MRASLFSALAVLLLSACGGKPQVESSGTPDFTLDVVTVSPQGKVALSQPARPLGRTLRLTGSPTGELYLLDCENHRVLRYGTDGSLLAQAGGLGTGKSEFNSPVDLDADGQMIWVLDRQNRRLVRLNHALNYVEEISLQPRSDDISAPIWYDGVAASSNGDVFLLDKREPQAVRISPAGEVLASYGGFQTGNGRLESPSDLDAGQDGSLYVTDGARLLVFDRSGNLQKEISHIEPLVRVEAAGSRAWITTRSGQLLYYAGGHLTRVAALSGELPVNVDLTLGKMQEPVLLDGEWSVWLFQLLTD